MPGFPKAGDYLVRVLSLLVNNIVMRLVEEMVLFALPTDNYGILAQKTVVGVPLNVLYPIPNVLQLGIHSL